MRIHVIFLVSIADDAVRVRVDSSLPAAAVGQHRAQNAVHIVLTDFEEQLTYEEELKDNRKYYNLGTKLIYTHCFQTAFLIA